MSTGLHSHTTPNRELPGRWNAFRFVFVLVALGFAAAAAYHAVALIAPRLAEPSPPWRHSLFIVINAALALGFVHRPPWFPLVLGAVTVQQLYSHGTYGWRVLTEQHRVDWASVFVLVALPLLLWAVVWERRNAARVTNRPSE